MRVALAPARARAGVRGVDFWCVNTDAQALAGKAERCAGLHIGRVLTRGLGAGGEAGVTRVLEIIRKELDTTMALCGERDILNVGLHNIYSNDIPPRNAPKPG